jgi:NADPH-dependent glutamate synthase beta subunit-like oxidoreductase/NAD-dependent dihydropyrimidine dehydrogenase PreA subunit
MSGRYAVSLPDMRYWAERVPCQMGCPVLTDGGRYVQLIAEGAFREAYLTARSPNPMASVCGRICSAPCEDVCRRGKFDAPVSIRALKRFVTERYGVESRDPDTLQALRRGEPEPGNQWRGHLGRLEVEASEAGRRGKVAVVGAGPAGLGCAHDLALLGHEVVVFEASRRAGGMAFHGIPDFRLPPNLLDKEVQAIEALGVEIRYETPLTAEHGLAALKAEGFEAFFLGVGAQRGRLLQCPGSDLDGIVRAIDYLININNGYRVPTAKRVLVVGGGFVAFDAARMALRAMQAEGTAEEGGGMAPALDAARIAARAGAEVTLMSLESFAEMPVTRTEQGREEYEEAVAEGIRFLPQRSVACFEGNGSVSRVQLIGVHRTYDDEGRFAPEFDESITEELEADLVILAIGQQPDLGFLTPEDGVEATPAGTIRVDPETLAATAPGVFAGGDAAFGPRNLIDAVANGKRAARGIQEFLGRAAPESRFSLRFEKVPTRQYVRSEDYDLLPREAPPTTDLGRRTGISEVETAYDETSARTQGERCLACHLQTIYDAQKCVLCNRCVDICPENCLKLVPLGDTDLDDEQIDAAREQAGVAAGATASAMLKDDERCIRCGLCAVRCPTDAMTMELLYYEEGRVGT